MSTCVSNTACVLAHLLMLPGSVMKSELHNFPFFTMFMLLVSPSEVSLYGHISCCLAHFLTHASAKPEERFMPSVQKHPVLVSHSALLALRPHLDTRP